MAKDLDTLHKLAQGIEKKYGKGSSMVMSDQNYQRVERIPVDSPNISYLLGGGIPVSRIIEIMGFESSGKSSLATYLSAQVQKAELTRVNSEGKQVKRNGVVAFIDAEHAFDPDYAETFGFDLSKALMTQPDNGEQALDILEEYVKSNEIDLVIVDSVAALIPQAELEGGMGDQQMGLQARLMSKAMRKITGILGKSKCSVIFINQFRSSIGPFASGKVPAGGNALKYYSSIRIEAKRVDFLSQGADNIYGIRIALKCVKNKTAPPMRNKEIDIYFDSGVQSEGEYIDYAVQYGFIDKGGAGWYKLSEDTKIQGRQNLIDYYLEHSETFEEIKRKVNVILSGGKVEEEEPEPEKEEEVPVREAKEETENVSSEPYYEPVDDADLESLDIPE
jgi:recombination protein RecA